jgi:hypothetical protein
MLYMNDFDIFQAVERHLNHPVLSKATRFLVAFKQEVDSHSDGWAYWRPPVQAAAKLMTLVQGADATEAQYRAALAPIKSFYTRRGNAAGMQFPEAQ